MIGRPAALCQANPGFPHRTKMRWNLIFSGAYYAMQFHFYAATSALASLWCDDGRSLMNAVMVGILN